MSRIREARRRPAKHDVQLSQRKVVVKTEQPSSRRGAVIVRYLGRGDIPIRPGGREPARMGNRNVPLTIGGNQA